MSGLNPHDQFSDMKAESDILLTSGLLEVHQLHDLDHLALVGGELDVDIQGARGLIEHNLVCTPRELQGYLQDIRARMAIDTILALTTKNGSNNGIPQYKPWLLEYNNN